MSQGDKREKCARCRHFRAEHFLEAGACHAVDAGNRVCTCQRFRAQLPRDPLLQR